ncbi:MAG: YcgN family cysteine cluster protein [Hyphomicrobiales bacterium]|nr:YcgN family cysteine cluster protein [Hyphomicrobiales bacterium]
MAFWDEKPLSEMSQTEWESLCDGCGRCCLVKLEDDDSGEIITSDVRCQLLDGDTCRCTDYPNRQKKVPDCIKLTPENVATIKWIPTTCAYRRLAEGRGLAWWHPLISGDPETVVAAGVSVRGRTFDEREIKPGEWEEHAVDWPEWEPPEGI